MIEQLTYLMFIRSPGEKELATEEMEMLSGDPMGHSMRRSKFKDSDAREIYTILSQRVFPAIKGMKHGRLSGFNQQGELIEMQDEEGQDTENETAFTPYMSDAMFLIPTPRVLQKIITGLDDLYAHDLTELDLQGKPATAGQNGQFRTPIQIREMMGDLL